MKKTIIFLFIFSFVSFLSLSVHANELLINSGFELFEDEQPPAGWYSFSTLNTSEYTFCASETAYSGKYSAQLTHLRSGASLIRQKVKCLPDTLYRISAQVRTEFVLDLGAGAGIGVQTDALDFPNHSCISDGIYGTGDWQNITIYVQTGKETDSFYLCLLLAHKNAPNLGTVYFDDISIIEIDSMPKDGLLIELETIPSQTKPSSSLYFLYFSIIFLCLLGIITVSFLKHRSKTTSQSANQNDKENDSL
ncbi:MAG: hypothetical protein KH354_05600 [Clostridiales bacterium]|nr:hypothetical protein [Clostridiales bacterium]